jgi:hypothetical protein
MVVILCQIDLQLPVEPVPIITKVVNSNQAHGEMFLIQLYVIKSLSDLQQVYGFLQILMFPLPIKLNATI